MRTISAAGLKEMLAQESTHVFLTIIELNHSSFVTPLRFVNDIKDLTYLSNVYTAFPFEITLPIDEPDTIPVVTLTIDNIGLEIISALRSISDPLSVTVNIVRVIGPTISYPELIINGNMELDSNWADFLTPAQNIRSTTQVYEGTYSRFFQSDSTSDGIASDIFTTETGIAYELRCQIYPADGIRGSILLRNGSDTGWLINEEVDLIREVWNEVVLQVTETSGGSNAQLIFDSDNLQFNSWYIDAVSFKKANAVPILEIGPLDFKLNRMSYDAQKIDLVLGYEADYLNESASKDFLNPGLAPGLF